MCKVNILSAPILKRLSSDFIWYDFLNTNVFSDMEQTVNYEDTATGVLNDLPMLSLLFSSEFNSQYTHIDSLTKISMLDLLIMNQHSVSVSSSVSSLYFSFLIDICTDVSMKNPFLFYLFRSDNQDLIYTVLHYYPEMILAFRDYDYYYFSDFFVSKNVAAYTDVFYDSNTFTIFDSLEYIVFNMLFFTLAILAMHILRVTKWFSLSEVYAPRIFLYLTGASREFRIQFDALLITFLFIIFYSVFAIMSFDDDQQISIESITTF